MGIDHRSIVTKNCVKHPKRGEIWLIADKNKKHKGDDREFDDSLQGGTRFGIVVSNNKGNRYSSVLEIVYTTTAKKADLPTHFMTDSTPETSTVQCEQLHPVSKDRFIRQYGKLMPEEIKKLNKCLRISLDL